MAFFSLVFVLFFSILVSFLVFKTSRWRKELVVLIKTLHHNVLCWPAVWIVPLSGHTVLLFESYLVRTQRIGFPVMIITCADHHKLCFDGIFFSCYLLVSLFLLLKP